MRLPRLIRRLIATGSFLLGLFLLSAAGEPRPVAGPGATKDEVIRAYGWPNGMSQSGPKEILSYTQGDVVLENGRVVRVNFSPDVPWQAPRPPPASATGSTRSTATRAPDPWMNDFDAALRSARMFHRRILALFTGSDWSPASREFQEKIETDPGFVNAFSGDFVFVKLDFPRGMAVRVPIDPASAAVRDRYGVTTYPTLLILSQSGAVLAPVDLSHLPGGASYHDGVIAAIRAARDATEPPAAAPSESAARGAASGATGEAAAVRSGKEVTPAKRGAVAAPKPAENPPAPADVPAARAIGRAARLIGFALAAGILLVLVAWRWLWRPPRIGGGMRPEAIAERIDAAAGGMPTHSEMMAWSKGKLCAIVAGLAEFDNYSVQLWPAGGDVDVALRKQGDAKPRILVYCSTGDEGIVGTKRLRELFGTLTAEGVETGWYVSPRGFAADARDYAAAHRIVLVGSENLQNMMREVPPVSLPTLLART